MAKAAHIAPADAARPRFLVDAMLGNVARDLRLLGFDAAYAGRATDAEVLRRCQREGRLLVTRDRELAKRAGALPHLLVASRPPLAQSLEVLRALGGRPSPAPFSRCLACNHPLCPVPSETASDRVPDHIALAHDRFFVCTGCLRVFWEGSHAPRLQARVERLSEALQGPNPPV